MTKTKQKPAVIPKSTTDITIAENNAPKNLLDIWQPVITALVSSPTSGIKNEGDAMLVLLKAHELGIGFGNSIPHIHVINGKAGIDIHIIKAILSKPKTGIRWIKTNDFTPIYEVVLYTKIPTTTDILPDNAIRVSKLAGNPMVDTLVADGKIPYVLKPNDQGKFVPIDYVTSYVFTRKKKDIDDTWFTETVKSSFKWSEAITAGLVTKDVWVNWGKQMLDHRAYTPGARAIASDLIMGNYSYDELLTMNNYIPTEYDSEGLITKITNKNGDTISPNSVEQ